MKENKNRVLQIYKNFFYKYKKCIHKKKYNNEKIISPSDALKISLQPCFFCKTKHSLTYTDINKKTNKKISKTILKINGLDRINSNNGYTKSNVVSCCKICNICKNDMLLSDFIKHIKKINKNIKTSSLTYYNNK
jgi:hypothetical protein